MSAVRLVVFQARLEQRTFWRNPDYAFFTFALPLVLLALLGATKQNQHIPGSQLSVVTLVVPGILAFGIIAAAYANLAARVAVLRSDGVLKRIRTTPLPPGIYLAGQLASTLITTSLVAIATIALGRFAFGVAPQPNRIPLLALALCLSIVCFAALALAVSTIIRTADAASPITNASYLPLALISGVFDPNLKTPTWLTHAVDAFPIRALFDALQAAYNPTVQQFPIASLAVLATWCAAGIVLTLRYFQWQPDAR
jgi:ABC-2 type transport system permease protein